MGIQLPEDLRDVIEFIGVDWPDIDEDELKDTAKEYRGFADELRDTIQKADRACSHVTAGSSKGEAVDAFKKRWGKVSGEDMKNLAKAVDVLADAMDTGAGYVVTCKVAVIADLTAAAASIGGGIAGAVFTGGVSALIGAGAALVLKQAVKEAIDLLVSKLVDLAVEKIEGEVLGLLEGLFDGRTNSGGRDGKGGLLPEGSAALGQELWIEFAEFEDAIAQLGEEHGRFTEKKDRFTGQREKRSLVSKKDDRFAKFGAAIDKAEDKVEQTAHKMSKELEKNVEGLDTTKRSNDANEKDTKDKFDRCRRDGDDDDDVPMYLLSRDGTVRELLPDGTLRPVDKDDDSGIRDLLEANGKAWRPTTRKEREDYAVSEEDTKNRVSSERIDPYGDDLGKATQLARYAENDYETKHNYAAARYIDPATNKELVLVSSSHKGMHSERSIGYPLLNRGKEAGLREVFTERAPCQLRNSRCDAWLAKYFLPKNPELEVRNAVDYDQLGGKRKEGNEQHAEYVRELKKRHGR